MGGLNDLAKETETELNKIRKKLFTKRLFDDRPLPPSLPIIVDHILAGIDDTMSDNALLGKLYLLQQIQKRLPPPRSKPRSKSVVVKSDSEQESKAPAANFLLPRLVTSPNFDLKKIINTLPQEEREKNIVNPMEALKEKLKEKNLPLELPREYEEILTTLQKDLYSIYYNRCYKAKYSYQREAIDQSTQLSNFEKDSKSATYDSGSWTKDFKREAFRLVDEERNTITTIHDVLKKHGKQLDPSDPYVEDLAYDALLDFTRGDKEKADVLNRFCQQTLQASGMTEVVLNYPCKYDEQEYTIQAPTENIRSEIIRDKNGKYIINSIDRYTFVFNLSTNVFAALDGDQFITLTMPEVEQLIQKNPDSQQTQNTGNNLTTGLKEKYQQPLVDIIIKAELQTNLDHDPQVKEKLQSPYYIKIQNFEIDFYRPNFEPKESILLQTNRTILVSEIPITKEEKEPIIESKLKLSS